MMLLAAGFCIVVVLCVAEFCIVTVVLCVAEFCLAVVCTVGIVVEGLATGQANFVSV